MPIDLEKKGMAFDGIAYFRLSFFILALEECIIGSYSVLPAILCVKAMSEAYIL